MHAVVYFNPKLGIWLLVVVVVEAAVAVVVSLK